MQREIIVLANSNREGNRCVAGICRETGDWIRPISSRPDEAIEVGQVKHINLLDIININLGDKKFNDTQNENYLVDENAIDNWKQVGKIESFQEIQKMCENAPLLLHSKASSVHKKHIPSNPNNRKSLTFIETDVEFKKEKKGIPKDKWYGHFYDNSKNLLELTVTDTIAFDRLYKEQNLRISKCFLTISLPANHYENFYHKLIAGVIWPDMLTL